MHSHTIARALADARVADLQRAATHTAAIMPPRRHRLHRGALALLGVAAIAAVAGLAPPGVLAQPVHDVGITAGPRVAQARQHLQSPDARDAADGRGTFNSPQVVVVKAQPQTRPALTDGIDWADAGIGAGGLLGMSLLALGGTLLITHRRRAAHM
jgi:hypothetical protein